MKNIAFTGNMASLSRKNKVCLSHTLLFNVQIELSCVADVSIVMYISFANAKSAFKRIQAFLLLALHGSSKVRLLSMYVYCSWYICSSFQTTAFNIGLAVVRYSGEGRPPLVARPLVLTSGMGPNLVSRLRVPGAEVIFAGAGKHKDGDGVRSL